MKHRCPICRKPTTSDSDPDFPFCSERCRLMDLGHWAAERYVVSEPVFDEEGEEAPGESGSGRPAKKTAAERNAPGS